MKGKYLVICLTTMLFVGLNPVSAKISPVVISEVFYDSPLNENSKNDSGAHHNGEFIELFNPSSKDIDISNWTINDSGTYFKFPYGTILRGRNMVLVAFCYPGSNFKLSDLFPSLKTINTDGRIFYQSYIKLSNNGEQISLYNSQSLLVDQMSYRHRSTFGFKSGYWDITASNGFDAGKQVNQLLSLQRTDIHSSTQGITPLMTDYTALIPTPLSIEATLDLPAVEDIYNAASVDTSLPVGSLPGQANVSPTGAATYQIPIEVPPGTNGHQPQLSIAYNSQGGIGGLGHGWDISGGSSISRTPQNLYYDGKNGKSILFSSEDRLTMDGQRLVLLSGNNLEENAEYGTEVENYARVRIIKSTITGDIAFILTTKDGQTIEYGNTLDSRVTNAENTTDPHVLSWNVNKISDAFKNNIYYSYKNETPTQIIPEHHESVFVEAQSVTVHDDAYDYDYNTWVEAHYDDILIPEQIVELKGKENHLDKISYANNTIEFSYIPNTINPKNSYISNFLVSKCFLLKDVTIKSNLNIVKSYNFEYQQTDIDFRLNAVTSLAGDGSKINSSKINWGADNNASPSLVTLGAMSDARLNTVDNSMLYTGDIDGDGQLDKIEVWTGSAPTGEDGYIRVILSKGNRALNSIHFTPKEDRNESELTFTPFSPQIEIGDFNNDGKDEIILVERFDLKTYSYDLTTNQINDKPIVHKYYNSGTNQNWYNQMNVNVDVVITNSNGDEYPDLLIIPYDCKGNNYGVHADHAEVFYGSASGLSGQSVPQSIAKSFSPSAFKKAGNFNGGSKPEIMIFSYNTNRNETNDNFEIYESSLWGKWLFDGSDLEKKCKYSKCYNADYNNDGRTDLLVNMNKANSGSWYLVESNGDCITAPKVLYQYKLASTYAIAVEDRHEAYSIDYNGDGLLDIILGDDVYNKCGFLNTDRCYKYTNWYFYKNTGNGFVENGTYRTTTKLSKMNAVALDINNDGVTDLVFGYGDKYAAFTLPNASQRYFVQSITTGMGVSDAFTYKFISNQTETACPSNVRNLKNPIMVVSSYTDKDGSVTNYDYGVAKIHTRGKGFLGFESITTTTPRLGLKTTTTYEIDAKNYGLYLKNQQVDDINGINVSYSSQVNRVVDGNEATNPIQKGKKRDDGTDGINRFLSIVSSSSATDVIKGTDQSSESKSFDANWNVTKQTEIRGDATKITEAGYIARTGGSVLYLPNQITVTQQRTGMPDIKSVTAYSDYNAAGQPQTKKIYEGTDGEVKTEYQYYTTGNLHTITVTPKGCPVQKTTYNYTNDPYFRFVTSETTSFNSGVKISDKTVSSTYDFATGNVLSKTGITGETTSYQYDKFGRLSKEIQPNGEEISYATTWDSNHGALYKKTVTNKLITNTSTVYFDWLGREVYTEQTGWKGLKPLISSKEYTNAKGQLTKAVKSHYAGEKELYTEYEYADILGRPTKESTYDGNQTFSTSYAYSTHTTTITPPDTRQTKKIITDEQELVVQRIDAGGDITYQYDAAGKPRYIKSNGSTTEIQYDSYGNQSKLIDPNAGTSTYTYFADGKLNTQTNAKGDITTLLYDDAGRVDTKTVTEKSSGINTETKNVYYDDGNGIGQLKNITLKVKGLVTHTQAFTYNLHHQLESGTETYDGQTASLSYGYDALWRPETATSPSGLVTTNVYDGYGNIYQVKAGTTVVWEGMTQNGNGQFTNFKLGNGLETNRNYSDRGELTGITTNFKNIATNYVQNNTYGYDATSGNLLTRNDIRNGRSEVFIYDALDRLTNVKLNGIITHDMVYDPNGNITSKTDVGTYKYTTGHPNAMSGIDGVKAGVSSDKQFIDYTPFEKVSRIRQGVDEFKITKQYDIYYGLDEERIKSVYTNGSAIQTRYYFGSYEKTIKPDHSIEEIDYICTPTGLTCLFRKKVSSTELLYVHTDHMGSLQAITNATGAVVTSYAYTAWGERKLLSGDNTITDRGYTGHEHLEAFGLINMNGRMYDPVLARFLSPDPYVQAPDFTQSFNRYSYCINNPLKYTDPSGNIFGIDDLLIATVGAAIIGGAGYTASVAFSDYGMTAWNSNDFWKSVGTGAASGFFTAGIGTGFGAVGNVGHELLRAGVHGFVNGLIADGSGGDFLQGFASGGLGSLGGSAFQAIAGPKIASSFLGTVGFSALAGGIGAELTGGDFWSGTATGAIVGTFNHWIHKVAFLKSKENLKRAMEYMEKQSKVGKSHEVAGVLLTDGSVVVWPEKGNTERRSSISTVKRDGKIFVKVGGKEYEVAHFIHTHPGTVNISIDNPDPLGIGVGNGKDIITGKYAGSDLYIIMDHQMFKVDVTSESSIKYPENITPN